MFKPSFDAYMYWSQVIIDRLTSIVHVYNKPPHSEVFIPDSERQYKLSQTADLLREFHTLTDDNELKAAHPQETAEESEERVVASLLPLFHDLLSRLPLLSSDMQMLLRSPWYDNCAGKVANELFRGAEGREAEGIGSGQSIHGRLPAQLESMIEKEDMGDTRTPREIAPPKAARQLGRTELARRWGQKNSAFLRSAGRMD